MDILLFIGAALGGYLVCGINPAIVISKLVYKQDIRTLGSGNAGFTNFKRNFGHKWAWWVLLFDLLKAAVVIAVFAMLFGFFSKLGSPAVHFDSTAFRFGAAYTGFFCVIGHSFPAYYKFKGGKGFLVTMSLVWFMDWRVGLLALGVFMVLLFTVHIMSLSSILSMLLCPIVLVVEHSISGTWTGLEIAAVSVYGATVLLMSLRHSENIARIFAGTEKKFYLFGKKGKKEIQQKEEK
ncbi:MAG: glycerol-3-phosphate acyltransferase [Clostridia bacterium]|nr:glycerol-3-phosphate acyltransferase [Clostridia bacterium]